MTEIRAQVEQVVRDVLDKDSIALSDSTRAEDVPGWDSLAHVNIMYSIETEFGIQFSEDEFTGFENVGELTRLIASKVAAAGA